MFYIGSTVHVDKSLCLTNNSAESQLYDDQFMFLETTMEHKNNFFFKEKFGCI